jgi:hypothetical protein
MRRWPASRARESLRGARGWRIISGAVVSACRYGSVKVMGIPSGAEHALPEDKVDVPWLADPEAYPQVPLRAYRALAHRLLRGPLRSGDEGDRYCAAKPRDGIGIGRAIQVSRGHWRARTTEDGHRERSSRPPSRAPARKRAYTADGTNDETNAERRASGRGQQATRREARPRGNARWLQPDAIRARGSGNTVRPRTHCP